MWSTVFLKGFGRCIKFKLSSGILAKHGECSFAKSGLGGGVK